ncbi:MAG: hypothetical protein ACLP9Y_22090 [Mycobacterium sp.]
MNRRPVIAVLAVLAALAVAPAAHADDRQVVCTGYRLGMTPDQIAQGLQRAGGQINEWQAWRETWVPIVEGDCDPD